MWYIAQFPRSFYVKLIRWTCLSVFSATNIQVLLSTALIAFFGKRSLGIAEAESVVVWWSSYTTCDDRSTSLHLALLSNYYKSCNETEADRKSSWAQYGKHRYTFQMFNSSKSWTNNLIKVLRRRVGEDKSYFAARAASTNRIHFSGPLITWIRLTSNTRTYVNIKIHGWNVNDKIISAVQPIGRK